ncbi:lysophospholipid acyltransferase family protein [Candidatus Pelagibacter sp. HIMB1542]|uniref:lysophospholipid acyltransferase family protein n=1 Tax=Candidatus Pelagibacter sp. HIMB1542 TaxID=3413346 RepID=UPI003F8385DD
MKNIKYLFQFLLIIFLFIFFKILGANLSSKFSGKIFEKIGPFFRSKKVINSNIKRAFPDINLEKLENIKSQMWNNFGRIFAEYMFIKNFRSGNLNSQISIKGGEILEEIKKNNQQVIFISGHLSNFELMAMCLEKSGIRLAAIYRPLNNIYLNKIMERIRKKYICNKQIKKGIGGLKNLIQLKRKKYSTALMIDQRVSEGILSNFFNQKALTTTIPAQLIKKFNIPVVPVYIERIKSINFEITINKPLTFPLSHSQEKITDELNKVLEDMIIKNPGQWIWSHNRWK